MTSRDRVLAVLKAHGPRKLPDGAHSLDCPRIAAYAYLGTPCIWEWSWTVNVEAKTSDYRARISGLNKEGYEIVSFSVGTRHGYVLLKEPVEEPAQASLFRRVG